MSKLGTRLHIRETAYNMVGAANGETLKTQNHGKGIGVLFYDCGGASRTGAILQAGEEDGQMVRVVNISDANETITFAAAATSKVASGTSMVISRYESVLFVWSQAMGLWHGALGGGTTIADGSITAAKFAANAVETAAIKDANVTAAKLAPDAVETAKIKDANVTQPKMIIAEARTATADGTGTGTISATATDVTVTCDNANKIIILPAPTPGRVVRIINGATGYELRTSNPATISLNGGAAENAESAIGANMVVEARCVSPTKWIANQYAADGTESKVEAAAA